MGDVFNSGDSQRQWLLWLSMKIVGVRGNRYLSAAVENSTSVEDFRKRLYTDVLTLDCHADAFTQRYAEWKRILRELPPNPALVGAYCEELVIGTHGKDTPYYLTDATEQEELEFVRCLHKYDYSDAELSALSKRTFPEVALYLQTFAFSDANMKVSGKDAALRERLTSYFQRYKLQKLRNRIDPDFLAWMEGVAGERPYNKLPTRSALVAQIPKQDTRLFFFDALGVEYLAYIQAKCDEYGLTAEISVGHCEVPLITVNNKEFVDAFPKPPYDIKELDELKHHSRVIDYQKRKEPVHLFREREIIDRHLQSIRTGLQRETFRRAAVVAGHGASRLAVIYERESAAPIQLDEKAEHSGRCCPAETDPRIPFAAWENGFAVDERIVLPRGADTRDTEAVKRIATAWLKLLFPHARRAGLPALLPQTRHEYAEHYPYTDGLRRREIRRADRARLRRDGTMKRKKVNASCGKASLSKGEIGINLKLLGENVRHYYCLHCLADFLEVTPEDIQDKIAEFKAEGCKLFE